MKDSDPCTGDSSAVGTNPTHRRTSSVGVDDATVPIPQTAFKKFYDSMFGSAVAGEVAEAEKVGTRSRLGPGARCDPGEGGDRQGETSGRVAPSRAAPKPASWFNPEAFTKEKREWMRQQREAQQRRAVSGEVAGDSGITSPFEHFIVCGLPTDADVSGVAASRTEAKRAIIAGAEVHVTAPKGNRRDSYKSAVGETYPARVLWCYPEDVPVPIDDVASFCFPHGVEPWLLERTPSMSGLNDLVYSQRYAQADDASFVWALRNQNFEIGVEGSAGDERIETLYGVCCYARELVRRRPGMIAAAESAASKLGDLRHGSGTKHLRGRYLIAADRCYCLISKVPFFSMHFEVLHRMLGVDRLERIRACAEELWAEDYENLKTEKAAGSHGTDASPIVGRKLSYEEPADTDPSSNKGPTPDDASPSDDAGSTRRTPPTDEELGERSEALRVLCEYRALAIPALGGEVTFSPLPDLAPVRFVRRVPDEGDAADVTAVTDAGGDEVAVGGDGDSPGGDSPVGRDGADVDRPGTPSPGEQRDEGPDDPTWQSPAVYRSLAARRRRVTGAKGDSVDAGPGGGPGCAQLWMTPAEECVHMETWTVAALCRTLSLDNVLAALNSVLLERQCAVFSPNLGDLGAVTLALSTTMLRPLRWRSLTLPVMPMTERMTSLLEAPVPFVIGIQRKTSEVRRLCQELTRVNVYKDEVKLGGGPQPQLPRLKELAGVLRPLHDAAREAARSGSYRGPVAEPSERARTAARAFLEAWREYLRALVANLRAYAITEVSAAGEKTSILLKDTWVDSFSKADRAFMRAFGETQMFDWYADVQLRA